jgi:hypothetical protein
MCTKKTTKHTYIDAEKMNRPAATAKRNKGKERVSRRLGSQQQRKDPSIPTVGVIETPKSPQDQDINATNDGSNGGGVNNNNNTTDADLWVFGSLKRPIYTVFFQGAGASQKQLAAYTGSWGFEATTGEHFTAQRALEAIRWPYVGVEAPEIVMKSAIPIAEESPSLCVHPIYWLGQQFVKLSRSTAGITAAPLGCCVATANQTDLLNNLSYRSNNNKTPSSPRGPIALTAHRHTIRLDRFNMGQHGDVRCHYYKWQALQMALEHSSDPTKIDMDDPAVAASVREKTAAAAAATMGSPRKPKKSTAAVVKLDTERGDGVQVQENEEGDPASNAVSHGDNRGGESPQEPREIHPCILYGVSRGAAATINALAYHKYQNVRLVILEACYDKHRTVFYHQFGSCLVPLIEMGMGAMTDYCPNDMPPIDAAKGHIPTEIPIGLVTSRVDRVVPAGNTYRLAAAMRGAGHDKVHVLTLQHSHHGHYGMQNSTDRAAYLHWLHALYRLYDLPHVPEYAELGQDLLDDDKDGAQQAWFAQKAKEEQRLSENIGD